ncbi:MAG TPA: aminoglycoside phosphotransferase family protein, partial [Legionella sp.]|nr:aminoglycoside phosphotransferase family protein [Legionella sp.]
MNLPVETMINQYLEKELGFKTVKTTHLSENMSGVICLAEDITHKKYIIKILKSDALSQLYGFNKESLIQFLQTHTSIVNDISQFIKSPKLIVINDGFIQTYKGIVFYCMEFVEGQTKEADEVSLESKLLVAKAMAELHQTNVSYYDTNFWEIKSRFITNTWQQILKSGASEGLKAQIHELNKPLLKDFLDRVFSTVTCELIKQQCESGVLSHTDMKPKNVLWDKNEQPYFIDWEDICLLKPETDFVDTVTSWAVIKTPHQYIFDEKTLGVFRKAYNLKLSISELDIYISAAKWIVWILSCYQLNRTKEAYDGILMLEIISENQQNL